MGDTRVRALGLAAGVLYAALIVWIYIHQPQSVSDVTTELTSTIGVYQIDPEAFDEGLRLFRSDGFEAARAGFERADPGRKDALTQFYIAYSFYREGWGRIYDDDRLFAAGVEAVDRAIALSPHGVLRAEDPNLSIHTAGELKAELQAGLRRDSSDLNPLKLLEPRK